MASGDWVLEREGCWLIRRRADVGKERLVAALGASGEVLKASRKTITRRVGDWVVKESRRSVIEVAKHMLLPGRYRQAWRAAVHLDARGVPIATPIAYAERRTAGLLLGNALVSRHLDNWVSVEQHARRLVESHASDSGVEAFLSKVASAVLRLTAADAFHGDLSGKNILTHDGEEFAFIDLDSVVLGRSYTREQRMTNHVQLYDSFCDFWEHERLTGFLDPLLPSGVDHTAWMEEVRSRQAARRARTLATWAREGRSPRPGGADATSRTPDDTA